MVAPRQSRITDLLPSISIIYLCCAIYELLHDPDMRAQPMARAVMVVEFCALGGMAIVILGALGESL